jgi:uncharacterized membrane protein YagU involved in acid resistance
MEIKEDSKFCIHCGFQLINDSQSLREIQYTNEDNSTKTYVMMVLSIVNFFVFAPFILSFAVIWSIFGAFSNNSKLYYGILIGCALYLVFSLVFFIVGLAKGILKSVSNHNTYSPNVKKAVIIAFVTVVTMVIIYLIRYF